MNKFTNNRIPNIMHFGKFSLSGNHFATIDVDESVFQQFWSGWMQAPSRLFEASFFDKLIDGAFCYPTRIIKIVLGRFYDFTGVEIVKSIYGRIESGIKISGFGADFDATFFSMAADKIGKTNSFLALQTRNSNFARMKMLASLLHTFRTHRAALSLFFLEVCPNFFSSVVFRINNIPKSTVIKSFFSEFDRIGSFKNYFSANIIPMCRKMSRPIITTAEIRERVFSRLSKIFQTSNIVCFDVKAIHLPLFIISGA